MIDLACAANANEHTRLIRGADGERSFPDQPVKLERFTIKELFPLDWRCRLNAGRHKASGVSIEIYAGKSLIDLQRTKLAGLRVYVFPVVKSECYIAVLLNLKNNNAFP